MTEQAKNATSTVSLYEYLYDDQTGVMSKRAFNRAYQEVINYGVSADVLHLDIVGGVRVVVAIDKGTEVVITRNEEEAVTGEQAEVGE